MDNRLLLCGYSCHSQQFHNDQPSGLQSYLFRLQTEGTCRMLIGNQMRTIGPGDLTLFEPGTPYRLIIGEETSSLPSVDYFLICEGDWIDAWWKRTTRPGMVSIHAGEKLLSLWRLLVLEKQSLAKENSETVDYLLRAFCLTLDDSISASSGVQGTSFLAIRMKEYIEANATQSFRLEDVAEHVGLSVSRTVHLFKKCFGQTIVQHATELRLSLALERMKYSAMPLEQVAESTGFGSYSYFHRVFRRYYGVSPSEYVRNLNL